MTEFSSIGPCGLGPSVSLNCLAAVGLRSAGAVKAGSMIEVSARIAVDRLELSEAAREINMIRHMDETRMDRVTQIREALDRGTYESDEKIEQAIVRLIEREM